MASGSMLEITFTYNWVNKSVIHVWKAVAHLANKWVSLLCDSTRDFAHNLFFKTILQKKNIVLKL